MRTSLQIRPGITILPIEKAEAEGKKLLTRKELNRLHLKANAFPCAFFENSDETLLFYFDPDKVVEDEIDDSFGKRSEKNTILLESGNVIEKMSVRRASAHSFFSKDRLTAMGYEPVEEPVAYSERKDGTVVYFYDKKTALRKPLKCIRCGEAERYKRKLCKNCFEIDLLERRTVGNAYRNGHFGYKRENVIFFDLELTGFYDRDEIISISITDGNGKVIMDTFVKPVHTQKWKKTEKIHGITPEMVVDSPTLAEITPIIKEIFAKADNIIAYGVSTDYSHIKKIYETEEEQLALHEKVRCCACEFVRFARENYPDLVHASLTDAMECLKIDWDGIPHSSIADTIACQKVWDVLFPNYYTN